MQNNKVFSILQKFDKYEQNRLRKFVQSPYFNRNKRLENLLELLLKDVHAEKTTISILRKKIWSKIGHQGNYDDVKLRKDFSDLLRLVEKFIAQEYYEKNGLYESEFLLAGIQDKKITKLEAGTIKSAHRLLDRFPLKSSQLYFHKFALEKQVFLLNQDIHAKSEKKNIETVSKNLDIFYISEKLKYYCYILNSKRVIVHDYDLKMMDQVIKQVEDSDYKEIPLVAVYYQNYLTLIDGENESNYFKLKTLLDKNALDFPQKEAFNLYSSTLNYCVRKINSGNKDFLKEYLDVILDFLEKGIILLDGYLTLNVFNNIVITGLRLERYDWVEGFIMDYQSKLSEEFRENTVNFNIAILRWYQKKYDEVISLLREVEYELISYNLRSKTTLLLTYYEVDEIEPLFSLLESFRAFLNRHKEIPSHSRKNYLNLIRFTKKLTKTIPGDKKAIEKLYKEITETKSLANKSWLLEKLAELS